MKVITLNANGLRSAHRKGLFEWLSQEQADIICLQEIRCHAFQLQPGFELPGYNAYFCHARKKGYSGVGIYTRFKPDAVISELNFALSDQEGRYLQLNFGQVSIVSLYFPSGTSGEHRQDCKFRFLDFYKKILEKQCHNSRQYILCGDWNIAHQPIDLKNWKTNQNSSGFLPEERAWLDDVFNMGYVDAFRAMDKRPNHYTWWSYRGCAWQNNTGWRIDYQVISPSLKDKLISANIYKTQRFSDHAPLTVEYDIMLDATRI